jgi:hypothetical protein
MYISSVVDPADAPTATAPSHSGPLELSLVEIYA